MTDDMTQPIFVPLELRLSKETKLSLLEHLAAYKLSDFLELELSVLCFRAEAGSWDDPELETFVEDVAALVAAGNGGTRSESFFDRMLADRQNAVEPMDQQKRVKQAANHSLTLVREFKAIQKQFKLLYRAAQSSDQKQEELDPAFHSASAFKDVMDAFDRSTLAIYSLEKLCECYSCEGKRGRKIDHVAHQLAYEAMRVARRNGRKVTRGNNEDYDDHFMNFLDGLYGVFHIRQAPRMPAKRAVEWLKADLSEDSEE